MLGKHNTNPWLKVPNAPLVRRRWLRIRVTDLQTGRVERVTLDYWTVVRLLAWFKAPVCLICADGVESDRFTQCTKQMKFFWSSSENKYKCQKKGPQFVTDMTEWPRLDLLYNLTHVLKHTLITSECSEPRILVGPSAVPPGVLDKGLKIHKTSALWLWLLPGRSSEPLPW